MTFEALKSNTNVSKMTEVIVERPVAEISVISKGEEEVNNFEFNSETPRHVTEVNEKSRTIESKECFSVGTVPKFESSKMCC